MSEESGEKGLGLRTVKHQKLRGLSNDEHRIERGKICMEKRHVSAKS